MSSVHDVRVVRVGPIIKHPNADALSITEVDGCPVIFRLGEFEEGNLAVYIPIDSVVPSTERWAFLKGDWRIRAKRLRGMFSMGMLAASDATWSEGLDVRELLGITVYEQAADANFNRSEHEIGPGCIPVYTDLESFRKYRGVFAAEEKVVVTEKIHGENGRMCWFKDRLWVGSRTNFKRRGLNGWWNAVVAGDIEAKLEKRPGLVVYGEVYGQVRDLRYGVQSGSRFVAFDALDAGTREYLDYATFRDTMIELGIPMVPVLFDGCFADLTDAAAEGVSALANGACIREGFVVRPHHERYDPRLGRVIAKMVGRGYMTRKGG